MMRIGILTMYYGNISHGGLLQAYSLQKVLAGYGYDSQVISYDYNFQEKYWIRALAHYFRLIPYKIRCIKYGDKTEKKYKEYMYMIPHSRYYNPNTICEIEKEYDVIIVGSDQVWNDDYCDGAFYLPFIKDKKKKVAYAASAGKDNLSKEFIEKVLKGISSFYAVSVRESTLQELLQNNTYKPIKYVCDPTMLQDLFFWEKHASNSVIKEKYILLYTLSSNDKIIKSATLFSKEIDLPIVTVPNVNCNMNKNDARAGNIQAWSVGPKEFLRLIMDAEYIITDSFHCTVFSLIFNKEVYCFDRECTGVSMNSRLKSLLNYCGIKERFIRIDQLIVCDTSIKIDYSDVNQRINELKTKSDEWLRTVLKSCER